MVGHLEEVYYLGAIAIGSMIFNFIYWAFGFLRMGTTGLTSQAFGNQNDKEVSLNLFRPVFIAILLAIVLIASQYLIAEISFYLIVASPEVEKYAREYFYIRILCCTSHIAYLCIPWLVFRFAKCKISFNIVGVSERSKSNF